MTFLRHKSICYCLFCLTFLKTFLLGEVLQDKHSFYLSRVTYHIYAPKPLNLSGSLPFSPHPPTLSSGTLNLKDEEKLAKETEKA